ncbi:LysM peptidoglycan-binding domain-containing protein [Paenibacillus jiagnxiensis]|uniref:LysM peptidoglycan-binding domain-containing protein n=1 Tax=Paenibacillus jiagnxiensis TaxID=3228926 RepID=UPI0033AC5B1C
MEFLLIDSKGKSFIFPVNPEEVNISRQKGFETINILSYGEYDFPQGERIKEISFSSFFPKEYDPSYCKYPDLPDPLKAMNLLNTFLTAKTPLRFIITETPINVPVFLASHNTTLRGAETGDVLFDVSFRTWRDLKISTKPSSKGAKTTSRTDLKEPAKTYTVKSGDSLSKIAKLELGNSSLWKKIYELNKKTIGNNPNLISPGQKLVMP